MGNSLPLPCVCQEAKLVATAAAMKRRRKKKKRSAKSSVRAAPRRVVVPVDGDDGEEEIKRAWAGCRVEPVGEDGVRVKVVMKRKDAADLMARLDERSAVERKARMGELNTDLGGMTSPCRDAWRPRLASILEN